MKADPTPLLVTVAHGEVEIDGDPVPPGDSPYRRALAGRTGFYPQGTDRAVLESYMRDGDTAYMGHRRGDATYRYRDGGGRRCFTVAPMAGWGIATRDGERAMSQLQALRGACDAEGWDGFGRAAGIQAGKVARELMADMGQLPPRWRALAHDAIHQGPVVVARGGAPLAVQWDRSAAFLRALFDGVPVRETWRAANPATPVDRWIDGDGIARATVRIDPRAWEGKIPPLPVRDAGRTFYPAGHSRGAWPIPLLRAAVEHGAEVIHVAELALCECGPAHAWAGERLQRVADPALRKILYTRYWGRLASLGGYEGSPVDPGDGTVTMFPGSSLFWTWTGKTLGGMFGPDYRPDHAAYIAGRNHVAMSHALAMAPAGEVVATHVDSIWIASESWTPPGKEWRDKRRGPLRFYGPGTYNHAGKYAAQGREAPIRCDADLDAWAATGNAGNVARDREWIMCDYPATCAAAESDPPVLGAAQLPVYPGGEQGIYSGRFTPRGWLWTGTEEDSEQ